jgi:hypothetical protein
MTDQSCAQSYTLEGSHMQETCTEFIRIESLAKARIATTRHTMFSKGLDHEFQGCLLSGLVDFLVVFRFSPKFTLLCLTGDCVTVASEEFAHSYSPMASFGACIKSAMQHQPGITPWTWPVQL